ncbi:hypothetical protein [Phytohabitans suffuscus]|uniref:Secreted protein n=1 Tax=Phytohabitans suffuscus TaxID=624315 RepID=A0A6F8YQ89_9ACTN|nr:hypothetical protein [Phytohabitans suffuscus]BCB88153.1 hypothetical protein Psuf_054660 [Phytohabitans suffuscus]
MGFVVAVLSIALMPAGPASASASGCTFAPGYALARNCIIVEGVGLVVWYTASGYEPGIEIPPPQVCSRRHEVRYVRADAPNNSTYTYLRAGPLGCIPGVLTSFVEWSGGYVARNGSQWCGRSRNTHTEQAGQPWSNWACITIRA